MPFKNSILEDFEIKNKGYFKSELLHQPLMEADQKEEQ